MKKLIRYFISGLILVLPAVVTIYLIYAMIVWVDSIFPVVIFPGFGILLVVAVITAIGILANVYIGKPFFNWIDRVLSGLPLVSLMYKSTKDILISIVGQNNKLKTPVAVKMSQTGIVKLGFITQEYEDTSFINDDEEYVAVYFPHSYNFSGNLFLVPASNVKVLKKNASSVMKFIVSGGIIDDSDL